MLPSFYTGNRNDDIIEGLKYYYFFIPHIVFLFVFSFFAQTVNAYSTCDPLSPSVPCTYSGQDYDTYIHGGSNGNTPWVDNVSGNALFYRAENSTSTVKYDFYSNEYVEVLSTLMIVWQGGGSSYFGSATGASVFSPYDWEGIGKDNRHLYYTAEFTIIPYDENDQIDEAYTCSVSSFESTYICSTDKLFRGFVMLATTTAISTTSPQSWKSEYYVLDEMGNIGYPPQFYSKSTNFLNSTTTVHSYTTSFDYTFGQATGTQKVIVCSGEYLSFPMADVGEYNCAEMYIGNGISTSTIETLFPTSPISGASAWEQAGCNDLGITDVFLGVKCAFIWGFYPSQNSLFKFTSTKDLMLSLYPIGYGTIILDDVTTAFSTTSTSVFDKDIEVKKYFGMSGGTTTISIDHLLSKTGFADPVVNFIETILWLIFGGWLLMFSLTRKL